MSEIKINKTYDNEIVLPLINQLIRSDTSIGANYFEANGASSKKEAKETQYWLRVLAQSIDNETIKNEIRKLWQEAKELGMIFAKIAVNTN